MVLITAAFVFVPEVTVTSTKLVRCRKHLGKSDRHLIVMLFMAKITALTRQKKNPKRINVFLDGAFAFGLAEITAVYLKIGQELTEADIAKLQSADDLEKARESALGFIDYRPRSIREVRKNLHDKGYDDSVIDQVIDRFLEVGLLDDLAFAKYWVDQRETFKPRSQMALRQELVQKGVDRALIDEAVATVDETAAAQRVAQKQASRYVNLDEPSFKKKMMGYLQRRGFNYGIIKEVTDEIWKELSTEHDVG